MTRVEIADIFEQIAVLLDLKGENPFKIRAYQSGARLLSSMPEEEYRQHLQADDWEGVRGLGEALTSKLRTLHAEGRLAFFDNLKASIPPGLIEMLDIPGLGPKKIKALNEKLGITSISELETACREGRVADLNGFGVKTEAKILVGIERREAYSRRHLWWDAAEVAAPILEGLRRIPGVLRAEAAGSLRRGMETVGDLDFIVGSEDPKPAMDWFCAGLAVLEVTGRGDTKCSVRFESGLQADLRVVPPAQFPFALHHFTGSKDHNIQMRQRALARGWSLSEWGLNPTGESSPSVPEVESEEALFSALGLHFIPPELREGLGELQAAEDAPLPRLVELGDLRGVFHNHTTESDGAYTLEEMAAAASTLGWEYLGIADHSKSSFQANGLDESRLLDQVARIHALNARRDLGCVYVFSGTECDILPDGSLDFSDAVLARLDYVVASVHSNFGQDEETMTRRVIRAIENPNVTMLGHPTGRLLLRRDPYSIDLERVIDAAIANNVVIELNANPHRLDLDWRLWRRASAKGLLCSINPDAHTAETLRFVRAGICSARKGWLRPEDVINTLPLEQLMTRLKDRKILRT